MPQIQFFQLQPRPNALSQALSALEPAVDRLSSFLAQFPEIEQRARDTLAEFLSNLPADQAAAWLSSAPNQRKLLEWSKVDPRFQYEPGKGWSFGYTPEQLLKQVANLVEPILRAPEGERETLIRQNQAALQRARDLAERAGAPGALYTDANGLVRPAGDAEFYAKLRGLEAAAKLTEAQAATEQERPGLVRAQTGATKAAAKLTEAQATTERERPGLIQAQTEAARAGAEESRARAKVLIEEAKSIPQKMSILQYDAETRRREVEGQLTLAERQQAHQEAVDAWNQQLKRDEFEYRKAKDEADRNFARWVEEGRREAVSRELDIKEASEARALLSDVASYYLGERELDIREKDVETRRLEVLTRYDLGLLNTLNNVSVVATLEAVADRLDLTPDQKAAATQAAIREYNAKNVLIASELAKREFESFSPERQEQILAEDPNWFVKRTMEYAKRLSGQLFDPDSSAATTEQVWGGTPPAVTDDGLATGDPAQGLLNFLERGIDNSLFLGNRPPYSFELKPGSAKNLLETLQSAGRGVINSVRDLVQRLRGARGAAGAPASPMLRALDQAGGTLQGGMDFSWAPPWAQSLLPRLLEGERR